MSLRLGVDVGGTKIAAAIVDETGAIVARNRVATPRTSLGELVEAVASAIDPLRSEHPVATLGLSVAGFTDVGRSLVWFAPNLPLREVDLGALVAQRTSLVTVVENDGNAAAWGEHRFGAARSVANVLMVAVGTGVGGGIVLDGSLVRGAHGMAAEIGHIQLRPGGRTCGCGRRGCLEQYASGTALLEAAESALAEQPARGAQLRALMQQHGSLRGEQVTQAAAQGDDLALEVLHLIGTRLGEGIADLVAVLDPEVVLIGGGVAAADELIVQPVRSALAANLTAAGHRPSPRVVAAELGNDAALVGAADLAAG